MCVFSRKQVSNGVSFSGYWMFSKIQNRLQFTINALPLSHSHGINSHSWSGKLGLVLHF